MPSRNVYLFSQHIPNQKVMGALGKDQPLNRRMGDEEGEEARVNFSALATLPLMTHHSPFRTLQLGSHIPCMAYMTRRGRQRTGGLNSPWSL